MSVAGKGSIEETEVDLREEPPQETWFVGIGAKCGIDWYASDYKIGEGTYTPKRVWLDKNHSNHLRFSGPALHMPDFAGNEPGKVKEYPKDPDTLRKSRRTMDFFHTMPNNGLPPSSIHISIIPKILSVSKTSPNPESDDLKGERIRSFRGTAAAILNLNI